MTFLFNLFTFTLVVSLEIKSFMVNSESISSIYTEDYTKNYEALYLRPWRKKHELNIVNIEIILQQFSNSKVRWLDMFCGQGWHFSKFSDSIEKIGVDISESQLSLAKKRNPKAQFVLSDILNVNFKEESFNLVTCFWAAYCYLSSNDKIKKLIYNAIKWTRKKGVIYIEVLIPEYLKSFNQSKYSDNTKFSVIPRKSDYSEWSYSDLGGMHNMRSPPLELFIDLLSKNFNKVNIKHDSGFMIHVIATNKK